MRCQKVQAEGRKTFGLMARSRGREAVKGVGNETMHCLRTKMEG